MRISARNPLAITGVGMVTSVGHDAPVATTSLRANITRMQEIAFPTRHGRPLVGSPVLGCADKAIREARLWELAARAASEAFDHADASGQPLTRARCGVMWILPPTTRVGYTAGGNHRRRETFLRECKLAVAQESWRDLAHGHASGLLALAEASELLARRLVDCCLIGGVDTLLQLRVLRWLEAQERLKHEDYTDGLIPGEAAAFFVVEREEGVQRRGGAVLARLTGLGASHEQATVVSDAPCRAQGLTAALREALESAEIAPTDLDSVYCDLNGESYRGREWGLASSRIAFPDTVELIHPADCIGDVGAVSGAVLISLAATSRPSTSMTPSNTLVFAGSETGERAAVVLNVANSNDEMFNMRGSVVGSRVRFGAPIPDVLTEHAEEVSYLWSNREAALRSPRCFPRHLAALDARIERHVQGLLVVGDSAVPLLASQMSENDPSQVFGAGYGLLRIGTAAGHVICALEHAEGDRLNAVRQALYQGPIEPIVSALQRLAVSATDRVAVVAAEVLAFHGLLESRPARTIAYLQSPSPVVRQAGWRLVSLLGHVRPDLFRLGWQDPDPGVRHQALVTAAWVSYPPLLDHCRRLAGVPVPANADAIHMLAMLGGNEDLPLLLAVARSRALGPSRYRILGAFGHSAVVQTLLEGIQDSDPRAAIAAGDAFTKITDCDIDSDLRMELPLIGVSALDEFEEHFVEEVTLPDIGRARECWLSMRDRLSAGVRWARGVNIDCELTPELLERLDLGSAQEARLRSGWQGTCHGSPIDFELLRREPCPARKYFPRPSAAAVISRSLREKVGRSA
jgi:3-oxoacyl-[acyl-carrier-protein] synthase-1